MSGCQNYILTSNGCFHPWYEPNNGQLVEFQSVWWWPLGWTLEVDTLVHQYSWKTISPSVIFYLLWSYHNAVAQELLCSQQFGLSYTVDKSILCWEHHLMSPVRLSKERNLSKDNEMDLASGNGIISSFTSSVLQQPHVPLVVEVQTEMARMLLPIVEWHFLFWSTFQNVSGTSCWVFKLKPDQLIGW